MAYTLTLNHDERCAIDWIGHRYFHGDELYRLLLGCSPEDSEWSEPGDITFTIPEHVAWQIHERAEQEDSTWTCFAPELVDKMQRFVDAIV